MLDERLPRNRHPRFGCVPLVLEQHERGMAVRRAQYFQMDSCRCPRNDQVCGTDSYREVGSWGEQFLEEDLCSEDISLWFPIKAAFNSHL